MYLHIHDNRTLREVQDDFSYTFPYLRLEFLSNKRRRKTTEQKHTFNSFLPVVAIRTQHRNGAAEISEFNTVNEIKDVLKKEYGLHAQIYHFTNAGWIETDTVGKATVKELNEQGKRSAYEYHNVFAQVKQLK